VADNSLTATDLSVNVVSSVDGVTNDGGNIDLIQGGIVTITPDDGANTITISATEVDGSVTNEAWTIDGDDADTEVISNQTVKFQGGGIVVTDYVPGTDILTITGTEVDGSITNEGSLTVGAGTSTTSLINSNTSGSTAVTLEAGANIVLSEAGNVITIAASGGGAPGDGDYGDITVSGTGTVWNIDASAVGATEVADNSLTATDLSVNVVSSVDGVTNDGGNIDLIQGGIVTITPDDGANTITISATEVDGSTTNEAWTIDGTTPIRR
jgi:hypothetical protein